LAVVTGRIALALLASLACIGCNVARTHTEVTPEVAGTVVSVSGHEGGLQTFQLDTGTSVTIDPARLDVLLRPSQGFATAALVLWGHHDNGREWIIATERPIQAGAVQGDCYPVGPTLVAGKSGNDVVLQTSVGPAPASVLAIRVKRAADGWTMTANSNGQYPATTVCLNARGEVVGQP
jgi:hypothetical protein